MSLARAGQIADAVLYEGYVLYPYRASAIKNRLRWPFGVIAPGSWAERDGHERGAAQTTCLVESGVDAGLDLHVRWLRIQRRTLEAAAGDGRFVPVDRLRAGGEDLVVWDEGVPTCVELRGLRLDRLLETPHIHQIALDPDRTVEPVTGSDGSIDGRVTRTRDMLHASIAVTAEPRRSLTMISVRIENTTPLDEDASRERAMARSMASAHIVLAAQNGSFVSLLDPPDAAREAVAACVNDGLWPVLVGPEPARDVMLASPIILYDYPGVAPESPGDLCDGTEIDEILTLRIMTLTDTEKQEARATDPRARLIVDRTDALPPDALALLHGAVRSSRSSDTPPPAGAGAFAPFALPPGDRPGDAMLTVGGVRIGRGSPVVLRPRRRADAMDMFLEGRQATVAGVYPDVDGRTHVAVTVDSDPARDLHDSFGRYFYFTPDEIVPVESSGAPSDPEIEVTR